MATTPKSSEKLTRIDRRTHEHELLQQLAARVRFLRDQRGMSRMLFAEQSGVSVPHIARLEAGQGNVSVLVLDRLARALGVPLEAIFAPPEDADAGDRSLIIEFVRKQALQDLPALRRSLLHGLGEGSSGLRRVALLGLRGVGKSAVGEILARRLRLPFVELDHEIAAEGGMQLDDIFAMYGQSGYRSLERRVLERVLIQQPEAVVATGGGIVTDPSSYELVMRTCFTVWLHAKPETCFQRVRAQGDLRIAAPTLRRQAMESIRRTMSARTELYAAARLAVDTSALSAAQGAERIVKALRNAGRPVAK
jgi:XRE family aerobic/anaerobic benzoate catabolism transcriptional regulator